jgi:hypothetical protein
LARIPARGRKFLSARCESWRAPGRPGLAAFLAINYECIQKFCRTGSGVFVTADGREVFTCDVGDKNSNAVIKLNTTKISEGGPVRINAFRLMLPS